MSNLAKEVLKKITDLGMPVRDTYYTKGRHVICSDTMIVSCENNKDLSILFHVAVKPDESASMTLELKNIKSVKKVFIGDVFVYIENMENVVVGEDAVKAYELTVKRGIIEEFVAEQKQLAMLVHAKNCHEC